MTDPVQDILDLIKDIRADVVNLKQEMAVDAWIAEYNDRLERPEDEDS